MRGQTWSSASAELPVIDTALTRKGQPILPYPDEIDTSWFLGVLSPCGIVQSSKLDLVIAPVDAPD